MELLQTILAYAHILSAMGWVGAGLLFGLVIAPRLPRLSLPSSREFFVKVVPSILRFFQIVAVLTLVFGALLLYVMTSGDLRQVSTSTSWGFALTFGLPSALAVFLFSEVVTVPALKRVVDLHGKMSPDGSNVPPELPRAARRAGMTALTTLALLLLTVSFMVAAGFY